MEEAEEGVREGGSARPPAAGAAGAAGAASRRGAAEHGAGAAVDTAGIPEARDALRAPRWKKCWLFGDEKWQKLTLYWYTSTTGPDILLHGQPAPADNGGKPSGPLENTNLISEVADCGRMFRR